MYLAEYRTRTTGKLLRDGAEPARNVEAEVGEMKTEYLSI
jgi:hypothetical protein